MNAVVYNRAMADNPKKPLLVKKSDAKKGSLWHEFANRRIIKQHGGFDIPEGDLHAIPKIQTPVDPQLTSSEENKEVLSDIEKEIQHLKEKDHLALSSQHNDYTDPYETEEIQEEDE